LHWADELEAEECRETIRLYMVRQRMSLARVAHEIGIGRRKLARFMGGGDLVRHGDWRLVADWCARVSPRAPYVAPDTVAILLLSRWVANVQKRQAFRTELKRTVRELYEREGVGLPPDTVAALQDEKSGAAR
jgi:hypothetical protein